LGIPMGKIILVMPPRSPSKHRLPNVFIIKVCVHEPCKVSCPVRNRVGMRRGLTSRRSGL
jgi:hypothetical protein